MLHTLVHHLLLQVCAARVEKHQDKQLLRFAEPDDLIVTSNPLLEEWHPLFLDALLASAAMDPQRHRTHIVLMQGPLQPQSARAPAQERVMRAATALRSYSLRQGGAICTDRATWLGEEGPWRKSQLACDLKRSVANNLSDRLCVETSQPDPSSRGDQDGRRGGPT